MRETRVQLTSFCKSLVRVVWQQHIFILQQVGRNDVSLRSTYNWCGVHEFIYIWFCKETEAVIWSGRCQFVLHVWTCTDFKVNNWREMMLFLCRQRTWIWTATLHHDEVGTFGMTLCGLFGTHHFIQVLGILAMLLQSQAILLEHVNTAQTLPVKLCCSIFTKLAVSRSAGNHTFTIMLTDQDKQLSLDFESEHCKRRHCYKVIKSSPHPHSHVQPHWPIVETMQLTSCGVYP